VELSVPLSLRGAQGGAALQSGQQGDVSSGNGAPGAAETTPAPAETVPQAAAPVLPPRMTELEVSHRMFNFLVENSDDIFLIASLEPFQRSEAASGDSETATTASMMNVDAAPQLAASVVLNYASPNVLRILGAPADDLVGRDASVVLIAPEDAAAAAEALAGASLEARRSPGWLTHVALRFRARRSGGREPLWVDATAVTDGASAFFVVRDASGRRAAEAQLRRFSLSATSALRQPCASVLLGAELLAYRPCLRCAAPADDDPAADTLYGPPGGGEAHGPRFLLQQHL
jgi:PAS domain-containing protein